eukprot:COSAG02_NODE_1401_length_12832_cov_20.599702_4_plen_104_part_00
MVRDPFVPTCVPRRHGARATRGRIARRPMHARARSAPPPRAHYSETTCARCVDQTPSAQVVSSIITVICIHMVSKPGRTPSRPDRAVTRQSRVESALTRTRIL